MEMSSYLNTEPKINDLRINEHEKMENCTNEEGKEVEGDEEFDISDSETKEYKEAVHKLLKFRNYKVRAPNGQFKCPFCVGVGKHEYHRLLEHAVRVAEGSTGSAKQRANHSAMAKYLVIDLSDKEKGKREAEENYRGLVEKYKANEVALSNLQDMYRRSILKEQQSNEELKEVRLELVKRNNEMADKLREAEENYGVVVKKLESSLTALAEKNSMLESELAQAKKDASSTVAKLQEVGKTRLQLQKKLPSTNKKPPNVENVSQVFCQKTPNINELLGSRTYQNPFPLF